MPGRLLCQFARWKSKRYYPLIETMAAKTVGRVLVGKTQAPNTLRRAAFQVPFEVAVRTNAITATRTAAAKQPMRNGYSIVPPFDAES